MRIGFSTWPYHVYPHQPGSSLSTDLIWAETARVGFHGIEISQDLRDLPPAEQCREQLAEHNLQAASHWVTVTPDASCLGGAKEKAKFLQTIGGNFLVCEGGKQHPPIDRDSYLTYFKRFDEIGQICDGHGIRAAFHFHPGCLEQQHEVDDLFDHTKSVWFCPGIGLAAPRNSGISSWDSSPPSRRP